MQRNTDRLRDLVSDLLETAALRDGPPLLAPSPTDVALVAREVVESTQPTADAAGVALTVDARGEVSALVDDRRIRQVLDNLVSNAVKYTDSGGRVDVRLRTADGVVELAVADTGIGIDGRGARPALHPVLPDRGGPAPGEPGRGPRPRDRPRHRGGARRPGRRREHARRGLELRHHPAAR